MSGPAAAGEQIGVVVTPIWLRELKPTEFLNVRRTIAAEPSLPHVFLAPSGLDVEYYRREFPDSEVLRVRAGALSGLQSYSRLMLSASFYERFADFEFIVLVQTDAFLSRSPSALLHREVHDYVGAPWLEPHTTSRLTNYFPRTLGRLETAIRPPVPLLVGNGGLSVRRTAALASALRARPMLARFSRLNEDVVLSYLGSVGALRVAPQAYAATIFFERGSDVPEEQAVFGFHALERYYPDIYASYSAGWT